MPELFIVATPIGNLGDITLRALETLRSVDLIVAEDTRTTRKLLTANGISKPMKGCPASAESAVAKVVVAELGRGKSVAFASEAGTPGLSDPGKQLVRFVRSAGFRVVPIPGPSAATALLSAAGHVGKQVVFEGFLSPRSGRRRRRLGELLDYRVPFILFESPHRVLKLLSDLADLSDNRDVVVGRELTKVHEQILTGTPAELRELIVADDAQRGEFTLLVGGKKKD